ncbi:MAG: hypothetical protein J4G12_04210 [Gemmatimonadetes bacterium]|nr:hypothetical protein [Gemmatimonadota bacterium]
MTKEDHSPRRRAEARYALVCAAIAAGAVLFSWPFLEAPERLGLALAAAVAWLVQAGSFVVLIRNRGAEPGKFVRAWLIGLAARAVVVIAAIAVVAQELTEGGATLLLGLATLFFIMLLVESRYFRKARTST